MKRKIKKIVKELKGASKMHLRQSKTLKKIIKKKIKKKV